jgi:hypothetical protein
MYKVTTQTPTNILRSVEAENRDLAAIMMALERMREKKQKKKDQETLSALEHSFT